MLILDRPAGWVCRCNVGRVPVLKNSMTTLPCTAPARAAGRFSTAASWWPPPRGLHSSTQLNSSRLGQ